MYVCICTYVPITTYGRNCVVHNSTVMPFAGQDCLSEWQDSACEESDGTITT